MLEEWINQFNVFIENLVKTLYTDQNLKKLIAQIKRNMFENNTHNWSALTPKTISNKKSLSKRGLVSASDIEKPNVRTRDLLDAFSDAANININEDFTISYSLTGTQQKKVKTIQEYGRDPEEITDDELNTIIEYIVNQIIAKINEKYNA